MYLIILYDILQIMAYQGRDVLDIMKNAVNYNSAVLNLCLDAISDKKNKVVDFGAGLGTFANLLQDNGYSVECIENDELLCSDLEKKGFISYKDVNSFADNSINQIVSLNVFEHIKNDSEIFSLIYKKLNKNGKFFLFLPANSCLYSAFDEKLGHYRRYDKENLENLLKDCGYKIEKSFYFDCLGFIFAYLYKHTNKKGNITLQQILIYDRLLFPISRVLDRIFSKSMGKNIVLVLKKEN